MTKEQLREILEHLNIIKPGDVLPAALVKQAG